MIDTEVQRLRRLRNIALRTRALALALESRSARQGSVPARATVASRAAVACWLVARVVTGRLRAHPYFRYHRGPSDARAAYEHMIAAIAGALASRRGRGLHILSVELQQVARELGDARALTWSADLSDTFGRSQVQIEALIKEADAGRASKAAGLAVAESREGTVTDVRVDQVDNVAANWPYLTF